MKSCDRTLRTPRGIEGRDAARIQPADVQMVSGGEGRKEAKEERTESRNLVASLQQSDSNLLPSRKQRSRTSEDGVLGPVVHLVAQKALLTANVKMQHIALA